MGDRTALRPLARRYRSLLSTYPRWWRRQNAEVVLDVLMSVHEDAGRTRPTIMERLQFAIAGLRVRVRGERIDRRFASASTLQGVHLFDQENGMPPREQILTTAEQTRANHADGMNAEGPMPQISWGGLVLRG